MQPVHVRIGSNSWSNIPVNIADPIRKRLGYGQVWPLRPACSQNRAESYNYARYDFPHPFLFRFSKEGMDHTVQNRPGPNLDGLVKVWPNIWSGSKPVCRNHRARFLAERNQPSTSFPVSDSVPFFHRRLG